MLNIARETDVERLRQMALVLEAENARLHRRLVELTRQLAEARGEDRAQLELELQLLSEQLATRNRQLFGERSERRGKETQRSSPSEQQRGHGPRAQATLPLVEVTHTLDTADQMCPKCGGDLQPWEGQTEDSEEIDVVERSFRIVRHRRQKYRCACGCIDTALGAPKLLAGGRYSVDFAVAVAVGKYVDHLPLARQVRQMQRAGLTVDTQTLWDQPNALERHVTPTYVALGDYVRQAPVIGADETTWKLLEPGKAKTWWAWSLTRPDAVVYEIRGSRSGPTAETVLNGFDGIVMCDGYSAYQSLAKARSSRAGPTVTLVHCWSHARRYFVDAEPHYPSVAAGVLDLIGRDVCGGYEGARDSGGRSCRARPETTGDGGTDRGVDPQVAHDAGGAAEVDTRESGQLRAGAVARADGVSGSCGDPARQRDRAGAAWTRTRPEEPLRVAIGTWHAGGGCFLQLARVYVLAAPPLAVRSA